MAREDVLYKRETEYSVLGYRGGEDSAAADTELKLMWMDAKQCQRPQKPHECLSPLGTLEEV